MKTNTTSRHMPWIELTFKQAPASIAQKLPGDGAALSSIAHQVDRSATRRGRKPSIRPFVSNEDCGNDVGMSPMERSADLLVDQIGDLEGTAPTLASPSWTLRTAADDKAAFDLIFRRVDMLKASSPKEDELSTLAELVEILGAPPDAQGNGASGALAIRSRQRRLAGVDKVLELLSPTDREKIGVLTLGRNSEDEAIFATKLYTRLAEAHVWSPNRNDLAGHERDAAGRGGSGIRGLPEEAQRNAVKDAFAKVAYDDIEEMRPSRNPPLINTGPFSLNLARFETMFDEVFPRADAALGAPGASSTTGAHPPTPERPNSDQA